MKTAFLKTLLLLALHFICASAFAYDLLQDPEHKVLTTPAGDASYTFSYNAATNTATIKILGRGAGLRWTLKNNALLDLRQNPKFQFQVKSNFPLSIVPRIGNTRREFPTYNLPPVTTVRFQSNTDDGRWGGFYFPISLDAWLDYQFDIVSALSFEDPLFYEMGWLQMEIGSERAGNFENQIVEIKGLKLVPSNPDCTISRNHLFLPEGSEGPSIAQVTNNLNRYRFFDCADADVLPQSAFNSGKKYTLFYKWPGDMDKLFPGDIPSEEDMAIGDKFKRGATPGEYRSFGIAVRSKGFGINKINIETSDLISHNNPEQKIAAENIQIYKIRYLYQLFQKEQRTPEVGETDQTGYTLKPVLLEPLKDDSIRPNFTRGLWVSLKIPESTAPGIYEAKLKANIDGDRTEIPLSVTVYPFTLEPLDKPFGIFLTPSQAMRFKPLVRDNNGQGNILEDNLILRWMKDIRDHGLNSIFFFGGIPKQDPTTRIKKFILETDLFSKNLNIMDEEQMMQQYERAGFPKNIPFLFSPYINWYDVFGPAFSEQLKPGIQLIRSHGWNRIIARQFDEPNNNFRSHTQGYSLNNLKQSFQTLRNIGLETLAESDFVFQSLIGNGSDGKPLISTMGGYITYLSPDVIARQKSKGGSVMPTSQFLGRGTPILSDRGIKGVWIWRSGVDGMYGYAYYEPINEGLNSFDNVVQPDYGAIAMKEDGTILPTLMWEMNREAFNDYRYIRTLETLIEKYPDADWVPEARQYFEHLKGRFSEFATEYIAHPPTDLDYEKMRSEIAGIVTKTIFTSVSPDETEPGLSPTNPVTGGGGGCGCTVCRIK